MAIVHGYRKRAVNFALAAGSAFRGVQGRLPLRPKSARWDEPTT